MQIILLHPLLELMHKKFKINRKKIKGACQSGKKVVTHNSKSDLPNVWTFHSIKSWDFSFFVFFCFFLAKSSQVLSKNPRVDFQMNYYLYSPQHVEVELNKSM